MITMPGFTTQTVKQPSSEELDAYLHLGRKEIARLVLLLLMEEKLRSQLGEFLSRTQQFPPQPAEG